MTLVKVEVKPILENAEIETTLELETTVETTIVNSLERSLKSAMTGHHLEQTEHPLGLWACSSSFSSSHLAVLSTIFKGCRNYFIGPQTTIFQILRKKYFESDPALK